MDVVFNSVGLIARSLFLLCLAVAFACYMISEGIAYLIRFIGKKLVDWIKRHVMDIEVEWKRVKEKKIEKDMA